MKFYLAGKWTDSQILAQYVQKIESIGHCCTWKWMIENIGKDNIFDATHDITGVCDADVAVFVFSDVKYAYRGTFTELGAALAKKELGHEIDIIVVDLTVGKEAYYATNTFFYHPSIKRFSTVEELMVHLRKVK